MNCECGEVLDNSVLHLIAFTSKSLLSTMWHYSNIECEALGILHELEKFHQYCFTRELCVTCHRPVVAILSKDVAMLSQQLQCIEACR